METPENGPLEAVHKFLDKRKNNFIDFEIDTEFDDVYPLTCQRNGYLKKKANWTSHFCFFILHMDFQGIPSSVNIVDKSFHCPIFPSVHFQTQKSYAANAPTLHLLNRN